MTINDDDLLSLAAFNQAGDHASIVQQNGAAAKILEESGVDEELVNKIKFSQEPFFEVYRRARGIDNETFTEIMLQTSKEFIVEIWDLIKGLFRKK